MSQLGEDPQWVFPFQFMEAGQSFFIPTLKPASMTYKVKLQANKAKVKIKVKTVAHLDLLGIRVWRIS